MSKVCPVVTPKIQELTDKIIQTYPEACKVSNFDANMCAEWIGAYCEENSINVDSIDKNNMKSIVNYIEKKRNLDGKSFLNIDDSKNNNNFASSNNDQIISSEVSKAIESGEWGEVALKEFNELINNIENGNIHYQRFPETTAGAYSKGGKANVAAWLLTRGNGNSNEEKSRSLSAGERYDRDKRDQVDQEKKLIAWAKASGLWAENSSDVVKEMKHLEEMDGGEAQIFIKNNNTVRKLISTEYFITPQFMSDRITLHNIISPAASLEVKGFTQDKDGNLLFVVDQPFIEGTKPTNAEIEEFARNIGFEKWAKDKGHTYISVDGSIYLSDLHDENIIKTPNGDLVIIDVDIRLNTPDLNHNGNYVIDNSLVLSEAASVNKQEQPKSVAYESALKINDSRVARFNRTFSPQQIKDRGAMISSMFSDIVDNLVANAIDELTVKAENPDTPQNVKDECRRKIYELKDPVKGRQKVVQDEGVASIVNTIKNRLNLYMQDADGEIKVLYQNTLEYFTDLFNAQASIDIEEREGIRIVNLSMVEKTTTEEDNEEQEDGDDETGHFVSGSDGWNFQVRYENPYNTLSSRVRSMLYEIERPENEKDDLGNTRYYPIGQMYASFLSYLSRNMENADDFIQVVRSFDEIPEGLSSTAYCDAEDFDTWYPNGFPVFPALEKMKKTYSWVGQVIQRLTDDYINPELNATDIRYPATGGSMASQFYTKFRLAYIPYGKIQLGTNNFGVTPLNYEMGERVQYDKLQANYNNRMILSDHSIYNSDGTLNKSNAEWLKGRIEYLSGSARRYASYYDEIEHDRQNPNDKWLSDAETDAYNEYLKEARDILNAFGISANEENVVSYLFSEEGVTLENMLSDLGDIAKLVTEVEDSRIKDFNYTLDLRDSSNRRVWQEFFKGRGLITDESYMQSFYDAANRKTKYSYSADNYLMKKFRGVCMGSLEERRKYIDENFGKYEWFKNQSTGEWRNKWLEFWYNEKGNHSELPYRNIDNITEVDEYGRVSIRPYMKWTEDDIWQVQDRSYEKDKNRKRTSHYLAPIFADSPMSMTVLGPRMGMEELLYGYNLNEEHKIGAFVQLVRQELWRIDYTQKRAKDIEDGKVKAIVNFDTGRGQRFCFLPELNDYTYSDTGETFLDRMIRLKNEDATSSEIEDAQIQAIEDILNAKMLEYKAKNNTHYLKDSSTLQEQYYNMAYANAAIIQITTVDLAFYSSDTDFQKRFKEVYASGTQLNTNSKYGKKSENVVLIADDVITSPSYDKIASIIDNNSALTQKEKSNIKDTFKDINVADAQAIRSMHSFRSVLDMLGNWDERMETALNHFKSGEWHKEDFDVIYQTIKPFAYSVIDRNDGNGGVIPVPQQHKNSEICALMMYDLIANNLNDSPVYRAFSRFMENTKGSNGEPLIDMIQYESAGKVGNQGVINVSFNANKVIAAINNKEYKLNTAKEKGKYLPNDVKNASKNYKAIKEQLDDRLEEGSITQDKYNEIMSSLRPTEEEIISILEQAVTVTNEDSSKDINPEYVHTIPFDNYYIQQATPEHHLDAQASFGSQARNIVVADLPGNITLELDGKGNNKTITGNKEVVDFYYELLNENLLEDFFGKNGNGGLKGIFDKKENLRDAVEEIVRGNPKYGKEFSDALQIDEETGEFVLSPNSPTMFTLMQEIITSFFKNRITKQKINGAALIQAAGIGLDENLRLVFDNGKMVGAECYMPLTSKEFFEPLLETVIINSEEVQTLNPETLAKLGLDKAVGYRIPTENKSSMMPLIIKGFTPLQNGSSIVLPAEITNIAGSDFDVDKMYLMLSSFYVQRYRMADARRAFAKSNDLFKATLDLMVNNGISEAALDEDEIDKLDNEAFKEWFEEHKEEYLRSEPIIRKIEYDFNKSPKENGRRARNNMIIQMMYKILTSKSGSASVLNPQGFPDVEYAAKVNRILKDQNLKSQLLLEFDGDTQAVIDYLKNADTRQLSSFISANSAPESPVYPQTFADVHARNMAGAIQIGIYAVQASMAAKNQRADIRLKDRQRYIINGREIVNIDVSDNGRILKNAGQMVGASADNGKKPNLTDMGSTSQTAPIIGYMLRSDLSHLETTLIINQPYMKESYYKSTNNRYWNKNLKNPLEVDVNVTTDLLMRNLLAPKEVSAQESDAIKALCWRILNQNEGIEYMTRVSRADSPNGSIKNSYAKARIQRYNVDLLQAEMGQPNFPFIRIKEALSNDAIDVASKNEDLIREQLKAQPMAFLHGMYALGINSFNPLVSPYFFGARKEFDDKIVKPILNNLSINLSDDAKAGVVNNIYLSYITYTLSGSPLFGNEEGESMKSKREWYLNTFPNTYKTILYNNKDIRDLLGSFLQVESNGERNRIILKNAGSKDKGAVADIKRRLERLIYMENPVAQDLAKQLLIYSYYDNGLQFTHDSFSHLFTTNFLLNFPVYNEALQQLDNSIDDNDATNFIHQFLLTYPNAAYPADGKVYGANDVIDGNIVIDLNVKNKRKQFINTILSPKPLSEGVNVYPYISYENDIYVLDEEAYEYDASKAVYCKLPRYKTNAFLPLFSKEMSVMELAQEFPYTVSEQQEMPSIDLDEDYPSMPSEYPEVDIDSLNSDYEGAFLPDDIEPNSPMSKSDVYQNEGEGELKDQFC